MLAVIAGLFLVLLCLLWLLVPMFSGTPWIPTRTGRIRKALQLARVKTGEVVYDLGCGDGRVLVLAAREFGAQTVGIELGPLQCAAAWSRRIFSGTKDRIRVHWGSFYRMDLKRADVVFAYLISSQAKPLQAFLEGQLKPGARVVTISFDFPDWEPENYDDEDLIFLYRMPPVPGNIGTFLARKSLPT